VWNDREICHLNLTPPHASRLNFSAAIFPLLRFAFSATFLRRKLLLGGPFPFLWRLLSWRAVLPSFALRNLLKIFPKFPVVHGCSHFLIRWQETAFSDHAMPGESKLHSIVVTTTSEPVQYDASSGDACYT
jgi:hypothetical protein